MSVKRQKLKPFSFSPLLRFQLQSIILQKIWLVSGPKTISRALLSTLTRTSLVEH
ncbi:hypothetical protein GBA52_019100, partial [Prunus armeniaca]